MAAVLGGGAAPAARPVIELLDAVDCTSGLDVLSAHQVLP
jgi:hypothetical protein